MSHELIHIFIQALLHAMNIGLCNVFQLWKGKVLNETVLMHCITFKKTGIFFVTGQPYWA